MFTQTPPHQPLSEFYITLPELPSHSEVLQEAAVNRPDSNGEHRTPPLWARVCLWAGAALSVVSGAILIILEVLS